MQKFGVVAIAVTIWLLVLAITLGYVKPAFESRIGRGTPITMVVNAGHGGHDTGAVVAGVQEKDISLTLALLVQQKARGTGLKVVLTRTTDVYIDLVERVRIAEALGAALYVSIHANYNRNAKICGVETWVDTGAGPEALRLGEAVQRAVVRATGASDRGIYRQTLYLRHTSLPAALVEVGYLTCPAERSRLLDPSYQDMIAHGILRGILDFLGL